MAKKAKFLELDTKEFETVYRILITSVPTEGQGQSRTLNGLLDWMEEVGFSRAEGEDVPVYSSSDTQTMELNKTEEAAFRAFIEAGIMRYQAWVTRPISGLLDRLKETEVTENEPEE